MTSQYLEAGLGNAWAGQVKHTVLSWLVATKPIIEVENFGKVVPIGSAKILYVYSVEFSL